jgi:tRNA(Ile)-lysidine synthase
MPVYQAVASFLAEHQLLPSGARVVVGVSGGADSLCLLDTLHALGYQVAVAHLDHHLRRGSWKDAEFVLRVAAAYGVPAAVERLPKGALPLPGATLEEGARLLRYRFLARVAGEQRAAYVAVGHTADDQAETILMHLLRGAGSRGLRGMLPTTPLGEALGPDHAGDVSLVRPLLVVTRSMTEAHCRQLRLRPRRDSTNADPAYFRNRLRHRLLPALARYNPRIREVLVRLGDVMQTEVAHLDAQTLSRIPGTLFERSPGAWAIRRDKYLQEPKALQMALLREAAQRAATGSRDFGHEAATRAHRWMMESRTGKRLALPGRRELVDEGALVVIQAVGTLSRYPEFPQLEDDRLQLMSLPFQLALDNGWTLAGLRKAAPPSLEEDQDPMSVRFDAGFVNGKLEVHPPRPGDRIALESGKTGKVSDLLINRHIPRGARRRWPVVSDDGGLLWVSGLRRAARAPVPPGTRAIVELRLVAPGKRDGS